MAILISFPFSSPLPFDRRLWQINPFLLLASNIGVICGWDWPRNGTQFIFGGRETEDSKPSQETLDRLIFLIKFRQMGIIRLTSGLKGFWISPSFFRWQHSFIGDGVYLSWTLSTINWASWWMVYVIDDYITRGLNRKCGKRRLFNTHIHWLAFGNWFAD